MDRFVVDPDAAQKVLDQQMLGKAHSKVINAVSDIQKKYVAMKRLEKSVMEVYEL